MSEGPSSGNAWTGAGGGTIAERGGAGIEVPASGLGDPGRPRRARPRARSSLSSTHAPWLILLLAFAVRAGVVLALPDLLAPAVDKVVRYDPIARSLLAGGGFSQGGLPTAVAGPVHPALLAGIYATLGEGRVAVRLVLALLDALQCLFFYLIARRHFGDRVGVGTGLLMVICPYFIASIYYMGTETPFLFFHAGFLLLFGGGLFAASGRRLSGAGALLGLATLCRPVSLLLPAALGGLVPLLRRRPRITVRRYALFLLAMALVVGPWLVRNYAVFDRFIPVQTMGGWHLYAGVGSPGEPPEGRVWQADNDGRLYRLAVKGVLRDKAAFAGRVGRRLLGMWYASDSGTHTVPLLAMNVPLLLLGGLGLWLTRRRWRELGYLHVTLFYYIALHASMAVIFRYMLPVIPILIVFAVVGLHRLLLGRLPAAPRPRPGIRPVGAGA